MTAMVPLSDAKMSLTEIKFEGPPDSIVRRIPPAIGPKEQFQK
jgi:hypothetical protein